MKKHIDVVLTILAVVFVLYLVFKVLEITGLLQQMIHGIMGA